MKASKRLRVKLRNAKRKAMEDMRNQLSKEQQHLLKFFDNRNLSAQNLADEFYN